MKNCGVVETMVKRHFFLDANIDLDVKFRFTIVSPF